ncbi:hypothetical protein FBZ96_11299 [Bradyrhizobium stylosanthis]|uniref:Uncharacterized protein n=1 Tax=Bradyrhizobium stylosanthis TaxID=1803665 RepID=A0A560D4W1_9BRAD|nr:hypothetical protein FBZ96_11299 [Bradyrhizobium stylosanthis]
MNEILLIVSGCLRIASDPPKLFLGVRQDG